jgi:hypothetical protein
MTTDGRLVPKLTQRKDGNWTCKVDKKKINLKTKSYSIARERALEAVYEGRRDWGTERFYDTGNTQSPVNAPNVAAVGNDWQSDLNDAASRGVDPDAYTGPDGQTRLLTSADAGDAPPASAPYTPESSAEAGSSGGSDSTKIPPEMFANLTGMAAGALVEAQLMLQAWLMARGLKRQAGPIAQSSQTRQVSETFWKEQLKVWVPEDVPLPPWASAMITVAMFGGMEQLQGSVPIEKPPETAPNSAYSVPTG